MEQGIPDLRCKFLEEAEELKKLKFTQKIQRYHTKRKQNGREKQKTKEQRDVYRCFCRGEGEELQASGYWVQMAWRPIRSKMIHLLGQNTWSQ